jgi:arabinose-5-phosphate isomerase
MARFRTDGDRLAFARQILRAEASTLLTVADRLDAAFGLAVDRLAGCAGRVAITGVGKSADVGQKIVGTFNSTGTRAYALDATRALHGDLGMVDPTDLALVLSHSGESEELVRLLGPLKAQAAGVIALTGNDRGTLARQADVAVVYGPVVEACPLALAPSTSTTVMLAVGDALAFTLSEQRQFTAEDFARYHPAGSLGRQLAPVEAVMRRGDELRLAAAGETVREVFARARQSGRRTGAVMLVGPDGRLCGLFTDSDLARLLEQRRDDAFDRPVGDVMTRQPLSVRLGTILRDALALLRGRKISELPVLDDDGRPVGLIDITDVIGLLPLDEAAPAMTARQAA